MNYKINFNNNKNTQIDHAVKFLVQWIGEPEINSKKTLIFLTLKNNSDEIQKLNLEKAINLKKIDDFLISNKKYKNTNDINEIYFLSVGYRGLANGIYFLYMKLKEKQIHDPFSIEWDIFQTPYFETRGMILFNLPFGLEDLTTETWTGSKWKEYFDRLRLFNYTSIVFLIHAGLFYHPDFEDLRKNSWRYDLFEEIFKYAEDIGLEIILTYVLNGLPTELWVKFPEIRGYINIEQGLTYCTQKGKEFGENLLKYTLNRFKNLPGNALFGFEGGGCDCDYCRNNLVEIVAEYLELIKANSNPERMFLCTWFAYVKENIDLTSIKNLRNKLFNRIPKEVKIFDTSRKTLKIASDQGFEVYDLIFLMDPEDGMENSSIFPKPHLNLLKERITDSIQELGSNLKGMFGYRVIPRTRFINDYVFGRYIWDPDIKINDVANEIAGLLSSSITEKELIKDAILLLEDFWTSLDGNKLKECNKILKSVLKQEKNPSDSLLSIQESIVILNFLFEYYETQSKNRRKAILQKIYRNMRTMNTFQCYSSYRFWNIVSLEMIKQRVSWWTDPKRGLFNPKSFPWNSISKGKYHLIDTKKDISTWF